MVLEKVIGSSSKGNNSVTFNPVTGDFLYIAGCFVVVYSVRLGKQVKFLHSPQHRPF
jgi:hypothetical protein